MSEPVVVAHGLWMPGVETGLLRRRLKRAGFAPVLFRFPTLAASLSENAAALERFAAGIGGARLNFVGYSLGGAVTLTMLANTKLRRPGRVVCLGSPLKGSRTAAILARTAVGTKLVGKSMLELNAKGGVPVVASFAFSYVPVVGSFGSSRSPASPDFGSEIGVIAGRRGFGIGMLVHRFAEPNDGTVAVSETELDGITAHLTLPVTHTQMLFDAGVARETIHFLHHGRFID